MKKHAAYAAFIASMLIFGTVGLLRRALPVPSGLLAFVRGGLGALFILLFARFSGRRLFHGIGHKKVLGLLGIGAVMGVNWILLFEAYNYTSVSTATLCYYMQPVIIILVSPVLFREHLTLRKALCAAAAVLGMVLVSGVTEGAAAGQTGILLGLAAAVFYAFVVVCNKLLPMPDPYEKTFWQLLGAACAMVPYLLLTGGFALPQLNGGSILLLLTAGLVHTGLAYVLYFGGLQRIPAFSAAVLSYIDPVSALLLSALFLGEVLTVPAMIGSVLIIASAALAEGRGRG